MANIQHIGITCNDIRKSAEFYEQYFKLKKIKEFEVAKDVIEVIFGIKSKAQVIYLQAQDQIIELFYFIDQKINNQMGSISHFALSVGNREKVFNTIKQSGVGVILAIKPDGGKVYFVKDPDGILIELKD
jgi:catechol 2,3-dioxygenase-like lactoylglutathione lyase family enzyme